MGLFTRVGNEGENEKDGKKTKMNVIQLEDERYFFFYKKYEFIL